MLPHVVEAADTAELTQGSILLGIEWGIETPPPSIVLTNPCDLENDKASFLLVAACLPALDVFQRSKEYRDFSEAETPSRRQKDRIKESAQAVIFNKSFGRYFSFDATVLHESETWLVVDFQHLRCLEYSTGEMPGEIIGELQSPYRQQMLHNFATYVARVGVDRPDLSSQERAISSLFPVGTTL